MDESVITFEFTVYGTGVVDIYDKAKVWAENFFAEHSFNMEIEAHPTPQDTHTYRQLGENGKYTAHVKARRTK